MRLRFAFHGTVGSGEFQNGTYHFFFEFPGIKDVFQMLGDGGALNAEKLRYTRLGKPQRLLAKKDFHLRLAIGSGVEQKFRALTTRLEFLHFKIFMLHDLFEFCGVRGRWFYPRNTRRTRKEDLGCWGFIFIIPVSCVWCVSWLDEFHGVGSSEVAVMFVDLSLEAAEGFVLEGDVRAECGVAEEVFVRGGFDGCQRFHEFLGDFLL